MDCPVNQRPAVKVDSRNRPWWAGWDRWLIPPQCLVCGEAGGDGRDLCAACAAALPWNRSACARCGLPLALPAEACGACLRRPPAFAQTEAPLRYHAPVDRLLPRLKFHGDLAVGRLVTELFADALPPRAPGDWPQALVPVPLHPQRLRERGYDQALELARGLSRLLALPLCGDALRRCRATSAQSELGEVARRRNVRHAFAVTGRPLPACIALVDDVMTTGATLGECARVLRSAGVARVEAWVIARVPRTQRSA